MSEQKILISRCSLEIFEAFRPHLEDPVRSLLGLDNSEEGRVVQSGISRLCFEDKAGREIQIMIYKGTRKYDRSEPSTLGFSLNVGNVLKISQYIRVVVPSSVGIDIIENTTHDRILEKLCELPHPIQPKISGWRYDDGSFTRQLGEPSDPMLIGSFKTKYTFQDFHSLGL